MNILFKIKANFIIILQFTTWLLSLISPFILINKLDEEIDNWIKFSYFFLSGIIGFMLIIVQRYSTQKLFSKWLKVSIIMFALSIFIYTINFFFYKEKTVEIVQNGRTLIVIAGNNYLPEIKKDILQYEIENRTNLSKEQVLQYFPVEFPKIITKPSDIAKEFWPEREININRYILITLYYSLILFLSLFIICLLQSLKIYKIRLI